MQVSFFPRSLEQKPPLLQVEDGPYLCFDLQGNPISLRDMDSNGTIIKAVTVHRTVVAVVGTESQTLSAARLQRARSGFIKLQAESPETVSREYCLLLADRHQGPLGVIATGDHCDTGLDRRKAIELARGVVRSSPEERYSSQWLFLLPRNEILRIQIRGDQEADYYLFDGHKLIHRVSSESWPIEKSTVGEESFLQVASVVGTVEEWRALVTGLLGLQQEHTGGISAWIERSRVRVSAREGEFTVPYTPFVKNLCLVLGL